MPAFFCTVSGVRIVAPGVSKDVDPEMGHDECREIDGDLVIKPADGWASVPGAGIPKPEAEPQSAEPPAEQPKNDKPARAGGNKERA